MIIKLSEIEGNAFHLISIAKQLCKENRQNEETIINEMIAGDYENLLRVFKNYFSNQVDFI